jgi:hypothetical protein
MEKKDIKKQEKEDAADQKEDHDDDEQLNLLLHKEIHSWDGFKYALREENAVLFDQMLKKCLEDDKEGGGEEEGVQFAKAVNSKGENFTAESLFMVLILQQQRMINQLIQKLSEYKRQK